MHARTPIAAGKSNLLSAICFATGSPASRCAVPCRVVRYCCAYLCRARLRSLGVKTLRELVNHDAATDALCEVELSLIERQAKAKARAAPPRALIRATLRDGSREFRVDGKVKTQAQVHALLHAHSVCLDTSSSVIRQAAVTKLADKNDPAVIGEVVADASGLARWRREAERAVREVGHPQNVKVSKINQQLLPNPTH
jgi:chromosome segregation ATPase